MADEQVAPAEPKATAAADTYLSQRLAAGESEQATPASPDPDATEIPKEIQDALISLATRFEQQSDWVARGHKRQIMESEEFWKGNHYGVFDENANAWWAPADLQANNPGVQPPRYDYVTNLFKTWGEIAINAIARIPKVIARPSSAKAERDIATAKAFSKVSNLIEKNNVMEELVQEEIRLLYVQGGFGSYVRFLRSEEYGVKDETVVEMRPVVLQEAGYQCPTCGESVPAEAPPTAGLAPQMEAPQVECPGCGQMLDDSHMMPEQTGMAPQITGTKKVAEGREIISSYGLLTLKMLPTANRQEESPYLINALMFPTSAVRSSWPKLADKIGATGSDGVSTTEDSRDMRYQTALAAPPKPYGPYASTGSTTQGLVLLKQAWLRSWAFFEHPDAPMRAKLMKWFPDGVHFNYVGKTFLSGQNENLDKFWRVCIGPLGNGIYRGGTGQSGISINKRFNDVANIQQEYVEHAAFPTVFGDARFINQEAWMSRRQEPGGLFLVATEHAGHQVRLSEMLHQPQQKLDGNIYSYGQSLEKLGEYVTGSLPTVAGGGVQYNETLGGYSQAREDALGRLRLVWKRYRVFHCERMKIAVVCFKENRTEDAELSVIQKSGEYASEFVRLDEVQGNIIVEPEVDEDFPATTSELRQQIVKLMQYAPEWITPLLSNPSNVEFTKRVLGSPDIIIPAEAAREKTFRDIERLVQEKPVGYEPGPDGQPLAIPSVMPMLFLDDHITAMATVKEWAQSSDPGQGLEVKSKNPEGFMNVVGYFLTHLKQVQQETEIMAPAMPAAEAGAAEGAAENTSSEESAPA